MSERSNVCYMILNSTFSNKVSQCNELRDNGGNTEALIPYLFDVNKYKETRERLKLFEESEGTDFKGNQFVLKLYK